MKIISQKIVLLLLIGVLSISATMAQNYGLYIAGEQVTADNAGDLSVINGVTGTVTYDNDTKTLTLENATINSDTELGIYNTDIQDLKIVLVGENNITTDMHCIRLSKKGIIRSYTNGSLIAKSNNASGIYFNSSYLLISSCIVEIEGKNYGINGFNGTTEDALVIVNSTAKVTGTTFGSIADIGFVTFSGCRIIYPENAYFDDTQNAIVTQGGGIVKEQIVIEGKYDLYIAGEQVTTNNAGDLSLINGVTGDVTYNHNTKTLTLENATINSDTELGIYNAAIEDLKIVLIGENNITTNDNHCINIEKAMQIESSTNGSLFVDCNAQYHGAILLFGTSLTIKNCVMEVDGPSSIFGEDEEEEHLIIINSTVKANGPTWGAIADIDYLTLDKCAITAPEGAAFDENSHSIALNGQTVKEQVVIEPIEEYDLYIAGEQVTSSNAGDLSVIEGVTGNVTYNHTTKTLTLENAEINTQYDHAISSNIEGFKCTFIGTNNLTAGLYGLDIYKSAEINGNGSASISSGTFGILLNNCPLTIKECTIKALGVKYGIAGYSYPNDKLTIENATIKATGAVEGSISRLTDLILNNCKITTPEGAAFNEDLHGVAINGDLVTEQVIIEPTSGVQNIANADLKIYPNPVKEILNIETEAKQFTVEIYNIIGKLVTKKVNTKQISVVDLPAGIYMLKFKTNKGVITKKIIK